MFIDTHAHIIWDKLTGREKEVVENAKNAGVGAILTVGCDIETIVKSRDCAEQFENVFFSAGIHPEEAGKPVDWEKFESFLSHPKCKAVGECGLDFYYTRETERIQRENFIKQIHLARKYNLPLIIHTRDAGKEMLEMIEQEKIQNFVIHCFTESAEFAQKIVKMGGMASFGGIITYPKADSVREALQVFPIDRIMLETDCPYLAPQSVRGQVNEPKYIPEIAQKIAEVKGLPLSEIGRVTTENARSFFRL